MGIVDRLEVITVSLRKPWGRGLTKICLKRQVNLLAVLRLSPCPEMRHKAILAKLDGLLILQCLLEGFVDMSRPHQKEQFRPKRLASDKFNSVLPFSVAIVSDQQECANAIGYAGIASKPCFYGPRLDGPFQHIPILLFQCLSRPPSNLSTQSSRFPRLLITQIDSCEFSLKPGRVENVRSGVFDGWKRRWFACDLGKDVEALCHLESARVGSDGKRGVDEGVDDGIGCASESGRVHVDNGTVVCHHLSLHGHWYRRHAGRRCER